MRNGTWRFIVPSLLTCTSIAVGFFSIAEALAGHAESAAWLVLLCTLLDKADGSAARLFHASSRFGLELDSLSDLVAFGVAPAVLVLTLNPAPHQGGLADSLPLFGFIAYAGPGLYVVAAALRLAKFNVLAETQGNRHFFGMPTTLVGGLVACYFLTVRKYGLSPLFVQALPLVMVPLALLMVSRIPLRKIEKRESLAFNIFLFANVFLAYLFVLIRRFPEYLLAVSVAYMLVGAVCATAAGVRPPAPPAPEDDRDA